MKKFTLNIILVALLSGMSGCKKDDKASVTVSVLRYTDFKNDSGPLIPADGATVRYYLLGGSTPIETKTAGTDGKVTFEGINAGEYRFNAHLTTSVASNNGDGDVIVADGDNKSVSITLD